MDFVQIVGPKSAEKLRSDTYRWARIWGIHSLPDLVKIRPNDRLRTTVARYRRDTKTIEIGARFLALRTRQSEVLAHEMAHAVVDLMYGRSARAHGKEWQALVRTAGFSPRACLAAAHRRCVRPDAGQSIRYEHRCPVCQMVRVSRGPVRAWRCRSCVEAGLRGNLEIIRTVRTR